MGRRLIHGETMKEHLTITLALVYCMSAQTLRKVLDKQENVSLVQVEKELAAFNMRMKSKPFKGTRKWAHNKQSLMQHQGNLL